MVSWRAVVAVVFLGLYPVLSSAAASLVDTGSILGPEQHRCRQSVASATAFATLTRRRSITDLGRRHRHDIARSPRRISVVPWLPLPVQANANGDELLPAPFQAQKNAPNTAAAVTTTTVVSIRVCMDVDCRLDGASQCWRMLQEQQRRDTRRDDDLQLVRIQSTPCLGPCGDGPNVVINVEDDRQRAMLQSIESSSSSNSSSSSSSISVSQYGRVLDASLASSDGSAALTKAAAAAESSAQPYHKSFVPAEMFGANIQGVYQVRDSLQAASIVRVAYQAASAMTAADLTVPTANTLPSTVSGTTHQATAVKYVASQRPWFDRPRNERLVLQRCMHLLILVGLANAAGSESSTPDSGISTTQWATAALLWILSNFVMKESLLEQLLRGKLGKSGGRLGKK